MRRIVESAQRAGASDAKVLITGESGVGKDVVAQETHSSSTRKQRPYVAVNCAGFPETLLESELFGHTRGSFTGADRDRPGKLQLADGGTLFLDEVGEMSLRMQAPLLRFLENGEIQTIGEKQPRQINVRLIAATNRDLAQRSPPATSGRTCSIGFASSRSRFRRCANGPTTFQSLDRVLPRGARRGS